MARPKGSEKKLNIEALKKYARIGATQLEIARVLGVATSTLELRLKRKEWREALDGAQAELYTSLRTKQVQLALSGNVTMLIWLGKQYLAQADKQELTGKDGIPLHETREQADKDLEAYNATKAK